MKVKVAQSCLTLCDPMGYTVHGIFQARILEWVAFPFSRGSFQPKDQTQVSKSCTTLQSMVKNIDGFKRQYFHQNLKAQTCVY